MAGQQQFHGKTKGGWFFWGTFLWSQGRLSLGDPLLVWRGNWHSFRPGVILHFATAALSVRERDCMHLCKLFFFIRVVWARDSKCCRFSCEISLFIYFVWMVVLLWFLVFLVIIKFGIACFWTFFFIFHILVGYPWCLLLNYDFFLNL